MAFSAAARRLVYSVSNLPKCRARSASRSIMGRRPLSRLGLDVPARTDSAIEPSSPMSEEIGLAIWTGPNYPKLGSYGSGKLILCCVPAAENIQGAY